jgi:hypothetical protein
MAHNYPLTAINVLQNNENTNKNKGNPNCRRAIGYFAENEVLQRGRGAFYTSSNCRKNKKRVQTTNSKTRVNLSFLKQNKTMQLSLNATAYSSKESKEFKKHCKAIEFCIENELSFPKETSEFFKGKFNGDNLEDIKRDSILGYLQNGVPVEMTFKYFGSSEVQIKVSEIPSDTDLIIVKLQ